MSSFCTNCGAPVPGSFCSKCGTPVNPAAPAPLKPASGSGLKILLIVLGVFFLIGVLAIGGLVYAGYRAKQRFAQVRHEYLHESARDSDRAGAARSVSGTCPALATEDAASVLGVSIEHIELVRKPDAEECEFYISAADRQRLADTQAPPSHEPGSKDAGNLISDALAAAQKYAAKDAQGFAFQVSVVRQNASEKWDGIEKARSGGFGFSKLEGVGDDAYLFLNGQAVFARKGNAVAVLTFRTIVPGRDKAAALARQVVSNL